MNWVAALKQKVIGWLIKSDRIHLHVPPASNRGELIEFFDRFLDDQLRYPLEWDDFISWDHDSADVQQSKERLEQYERLLFAGGAKGYERYRSRVLEERNRVAQLTGLPARDLPPDAWRAT